MPLIVKINPRRPQRAIINYAARLLKAGRIIVFPTETLYGLAARALNGRAVKKIFTVKGRPSSKPLIILIAEKKELKKLVQEVPEAAQALIKKFWPGPLTLIFKKKSIVPAAVAAGGKTIAIRLSSHPVARALVKALGAPITAPSANISGEPPHRRFKDVYEELGRKKDIALFLDGGTTPFYKASTLVDMTQEPPRLLREGSITRKRLLKVFKIAN